MPLFDHSCGQLTVEQSNVQQYVLVEESMVRLQEFARRNVKVRPGFLEFDGRTLPCYLYMG